ncbi:large conductance mechanosensitive channel protein MscL [Ampullimonas aquatilis]|uniref:large conductance mechanosensitive channel protein MscL n=1 Tax=Ampullimonas aquatilis TaxID=1341549 RepID=UPI003C7492E8
MRFFRDFRKFAMRGNLIDLAVGFTVGTAFSTIAKSLVDDIIMPPVGLLLGRTDFSGLFFILKAGPENRGPYVTLADAHAAGAVTINYGLFINNLIAFLLVAMAMFILIRLFTQAEAKLDSAFDEPDEENEPTDKKCPYCRSTIDFRATRCPHCTSVLPGNLLPPTAVQHDASPVRHPLS